MTDWKFGRRHGQCAGCERAFTEDEAHVSMLSIAGDEPQREDVCLECWTRRETHDEVFWWRTYHRVGKRKGLALNLEALEAFFLALEDKQDRTLRELRYILCLILMRKRRLKIVRIVRGKAGEAMLVRRPRRKEALRVWVFDFSAERMEALRVQLVRIFDGDEGDVVGTSEAANSGEGPDEPEASEEPEDFGPPGRDEASSADPARSARS
ncbi:MAG TPA: hypothetical protein VKB65_05170 [Myxococcota bacterium]|nr:hypothetical protein [Myxococcota bacterium]